MNPVSITEILDSHSPAIASVARGFENGELVVRALLVISISELNDYFNITNVMNESQTIETINLICERFKHYKLADFKLCFKRAKMGLYGSGKLYNRIDGMILFEWLNAYDLERLDEAERISINKHESIKKGLHDQSEPNPEGQKKVTEIMKDAIKGIDEKQIEKKPREKTQAETQIQKILTEFDELWDKNKTSEYGAKFIKLGDKVYSQSEYLEFKINEHLNNVNPI